MREEEEEEEEGGEACCGTIPLNGIKNFLVV